MKTITEILTKLGAVSPFTAVTTEAVIKAVRSEPIPKDQWGKPVGQDRLVYTELIRSPDVQRIDIETGDEVDVNGWYVK